MIVGIAVPTTVVSSAPSAMPSIRAATNSQDCVRLIPSVRLFARDLPANVSILAADALLDSFHSVSASTRAVSPPILPVLVPPATLTLHGIRAMLHRPERN